MHKPSTIYIAIKKVGLLLVDPCINGYEEKLTCAIYIGIYFRYVYSCVDGGVHENITLYYSTYFLLDLPINSSINVSCPSW